MIHPLSEEFNGWLSAVEFLLWHVEIINEDAIFLASWWSIDTFPPLLKLFVERILGLVG
jgi:hypothetical protein